MNIAVGVSIVSVCVVFIFSLATFIFNLKNSKRSDTNSLKEEIRNETKTNVMLNMINSTTQEIKTKMETMREEIKSQNERLIIVEQRTKSAHKRLDELVERLSKEKRTSKEKEEE